MRAYLVNPVDKTVTLVEHDGDYRDIYKHIEAECFTALTLNSSGDALYLDDEGLYRDGQAFFHLKGYPQPLAGRGLLLGTDHEGDSRAPVIALEQFQKLIAWAPEGLRFEGITQTEEHDEMMFVIRQTPEFKIVSFAAEVGAPASGRWARNARRFGTRQEAEDWIREMTRSITTPVETRVVESDDPVNSVFENGAARPING